MNNTKINRRKCPKRLTLRLDKKLPDMHHLRYDSPVKQDLAVGLVYYNSTASKRILMNYLYILEKLKLANIPTYTIEMYEKTPEIKEAIHVKTDFTLFQKERLCRILEKHIPKSFTKIAFIDGDVLFDNPNWYNELSNSLNTMNVVQPYVKAHWLDITYKKSLRTALSISMLTCTKLTNYIEFHPGFAWAFQRQWYNDVGFYEEVLGAADTISTHTWFDLPIDSNKLHYQLDLVDEYREKVKQNPPIVGYIHGNIYHLYHGDFKKRQYSSKHKIFKYVKDIRDVVEIDKNGLFTLKDDTFKSRIRKYFKNRDDDGM